MTSTPFDLDAVEAEATAETFDFTLKGETFSLPPFRGLDYRLALDGDYDANGNPTLPEMRRILRVAMGDEQWDRFDALPLTISGLSAIFDQWDAGAAEALGESEASTAS